MMRFSSTQFLMALLTLAFIFESPVKAQDELSGMKNELNQEIQDLYPEVKLRPARKLPPVNKKVVVRSEEIVAPAETTQVVIEEAPQPQQVEIVRSAPVTSSRPVLRVRQEPLTLVEANPVDESNADKLRRSRMDYEQETESKLVEKLESERISAERERRKAILNKLEGKKEETQLEAAPSVPTYNAYPQAPVAVQPVIEDEVVSVDSMSTTLEPSMTQPKNKFFVGANGGVGIFHTVDNIENGFSGGFSVGMMFQEGWLAELGFNYAEYQMERVDSLYSDPYAIGEITEMEEYGVSLGVKYQILREKIRPVVGILGLYRNRTYSQSQYAAGYPPNVETTTNALDFGLSAGVDFALSESFSLGTELRYMINLTSRVDGGTTDLYYAEANNYESSEDINYMVFGLNAKAIF